MGQYYKAVFLNAKEEPSAHVSSYDFGNGANIVGDLTTLLDLWKRY
jgi:hypothetical protein